MMDERNKSIRIEHDEEQELLFLYLNGDYHSSWPDDDLEELREYLDYLDNTLDLSTGQFC